MDNIDDILKKTYSEKQISDAKASGEYVFMVENILEHQKKYAELIKKKISEKEKSVSGESPEEKNKREETAQKYKKIYASANKKIKDVIAPEFTQESEKLIKEYFEKNGLPEDLLNGSTKDKYYQLAKAWKIGKPKVLSFSDEQEDIKQGVVQGEWEKRYDAFFKNLNEKKEGVSYRSEFLHPGLKTVRNDEEFIYVAPGKVNVSGERSMDGWRDQILLAKEEKIGAVDFSKITNESNKARLYALCLAHNIETLNLSEKPKAEVLEKVLSELSVKERADYGANKQKKANVKPIGRSEGR